MFQRKDRIGIICMVEMQEVNWNDIEEIIKKLSKSILN